MQLDRELTAVIKEVIGATDLGEPASALRTYLRKLCGNGQFEKFALEKARVATLVHLARHRESLVEMLSEERVARIEGMLRQIVKALKERKIFLLRGGALEQLSVIKTNGTVERVS